MSFITNKIGRTAIMAVAGLSVALGMSACGSMTADPTPSSTRSVPSMPSELPSGVVNTHVEDPDSTPQQTPDAVSDPSQLKGIDDSGAKPPSGFVGNPDDPNMFIFLLQAAVKVDESSTPASVGQKFVEIYCPTSNSVAQMTPDNYSMFSSRLELIQEDWKTRFPDNPNAAAEYDAAVAAHSDTQTITGVYGNTVQTCSYK